MTIVSVYIFFLINTAFAGNGQFVFTKNIDLFGEIL